MAENNRKIDMSFDWKRDGKKIILLIILIAILIFVWMRIFTSQSGVINKKNPSHVVEKNEPPIEDKKIEITKEVKEVDIRDLLSKPLFSYRSPLTFTVKRNPFSPPFATVSAKEPETQTVVGEPEVSLPDDIVLTGIISTGKEVYAIIEGLDLREVVVEGDEILDGFIVDKIDVKNKRVILKKDKKRFILELRGE